MSTHALDVQRIYVELDALKEELQGLKQMVKQAIASPRPGLQTEHPHIVRVERIRG